jgi:hypothetical protein
MDEAALYRVRSQIMSEKSATPDFKDDHLEEFSKLTGDFLEKYFSKEVISALEVEVKFMHKEKGTVLSSMTLGCIQGTPEDLIRCFPGQKWGKRP